MRPDLCGFCGEGGCRLELREGSGDGKKALYSRVDSFEIISTRNTKKVFELEGVRVEQPSDLRKGEEQRVKSIEVFKFEMAEAFYYCFNIS
jgi:hypothetical protein